MFINKVEILFQFHLKSGFNHVHKWPSWSWSWSGPNISPGGTRLWSPHGWSSCQWKSRHQPEDLFVRQLIPSNGWSQNCFAWTVQLELQNEICETTKRKTYPSDMLFQDRPGTFEDGHVCCWEVEVVHVPRQLGILPCTDIWDTILSCTNTWVWLKFCIFSCLRFPIFLSVWVCDCFAYISSSPHISNKFVSVYSAIIIRWERGAFLSRTGIWCVTMIGRHNIGSKPLGSSEGYFVCFA